MSSMSSPLRIDRDSTGIVTLWLDPNPAKPRGGVVVLDAWLIGAIAEACATIARDGCTGLVLASASTRVFVAGADLAEIDALDDPALHAYLERGAAAFAAIPALGVPTAAVVHKAALGGGLELAMHCDALFGREPDAGEKPWMIGLPECGLCICPGWGGTQMLPARIDPATAIVATANGAPWLCTAVPAGLFERVLPPGTTVEAMVAEARAWVAGERAAGYPASKSPRRTITPAAVSPASPPSTGCHPATNAAIVAAGLASARATVAASAHAAACFECVELGTRQGWAAAVAAERANLVRLRHTPEARAKLQAFLSR